MQYIIADDDQLAKFKQKFTQFSEFYNLMDAKRGQNNTFSLEFQCTSCVKIIRANSRAPTSNLKSHISKCHPENLNFFLSLRGCNKDKVGVSIEKIFWIKSFFVIILLQYLTKNLLHDHLEFYKKKLSDS